MEAYVQDVINRYELGKKGLSIEEQKLVKDIVLGMLEIASKGAERCCRQAYKTAGLISAIIQI